MALFATTILSVAPGVCAQSKGGTDQVQKDATSVSPAAPKSVSVAYRRPTEGEKIRNFAFDAFGPYPFASAIVAATYQQARGTPPDWGQGWDSFATRFGSDYGIQLVTTTTRYALAEAFREDTLYYPCSCTDFRSRLKHALISTVTARRGGDGHRVFSLAALSAPYAGTTVAAVGWYPSRYSAMDGFRMGNYNLAGAAIQNIALEFVYGGPHTILGRIPMPTPRHGGPNPNPE
jgi:hypothetical protein